MKQVFKPYAKKSGKDRFLVEQFGWIDLATAYANGVVVGDLDGVENNSNEIEDAASILGKPRDVFEAYRMKTYIDNSASKGAKSETSQTISTETNSTE